MKKKNGLFSDISKSGFMRSVMTRVLTIFITVSVIIAVVTFWSFTAEVRRSILDDRQKQLGIVESTISERMDELTSIAYHIGQDPIFYMEAVDNDPQSSREIAEMLSRYLTGNNFIEHLAYARVSEPDTIYTAKGERSLSQFFTGSFGMDEKTVEGIVAGINAEAHTDVRVFGSGDTAYFAYLYPLPQLSPEPQAHVLMLIPFKEVKPLFDSLYNGVQGELAVFDAFDAEICRTGNLNDELDLTEFLKSENVEEEYKSASGKKYVLQKTVSATNSWTYISVIRHSDTLSGIANKQLAFIIFILLLLMAAIVVMLASIIAQFKPISNLAAQMAEHNPDSDEPDVVDERAFLTDKIATLKDESAQKQKFETAFYEAEAASKAKSAFLSSMSHDIRTPMNAIIGMTAIARKHIGDQAYVDECLEKVQVSSEYLLDIINNVLDMSRIESGRIPIVREPVIIPALVDSVVSLMTSSVEAKRQTLTVDIRTLSQPAVLGDNIHLVQVFVNIVSNAVKFTPEGGKITLTIRQEPSDDAQFGNYVFTFTDTGIGIPPEFIGQVFETFARAENSAATRSEGTGLGMAIAKKLVELMGGTISCESELGHGSTFTVALRMELVDEAAAKARAEESGLLHGNHAEGEATAIDLTGKHILLVEDNAMNREIANRIISETGAEITDARNGKEAIDVFSAHPSDYFDLIFMDIQMPVMNGYESTAVIRAMDRPDAKTVPIYAMTANTFDEDVRQVKDAGMNGHIGKPYNPQTLYAVLAHALR